MKKIFTLCVSFLSCIVAVQAQSTQGKISGTVADGTNVAIAATVSLLRSADSALVKTAVSGKDGKYEFAV
ncbi:MAG: hypothetical protein U0U70_04620 [Chitinophagaceae bacterium]